MDVELPDIDGREAVRVLRKNGFKSPIIMLTGHSTDSDTILGLELGARSRRRYPTGKDQKPTTGLQGAERLKRRSKQFAMRPAPTEQDSRDEGGEEDWAG
jgi:hypothetical protein